MTGWPVSRKCSLACWRGLESQQPTWPQVRHIRRCAQVFSPSSAQPWHCPGVRGSRSSVAVKRCSQVFGAADAFASRPRDLFSMLSKDRHADRSRFGRGGSTKCMAHCSRCWWCRSCWPRWRRRFDVSAPLALVVAGLAASGIPGFTDIELEPELVLDVLLPPLLWSAGLESSYVGLKNNLRPIGLLAVGLPLATTFAVGFVAYKTVPDLTIAAGLTLGAIVAPPDAVSATAVGRRLGLPRRIMTLLGGESLLNDATALTAYKVALAAAIGAATSWGSGVVTFALAAGGGVAIGIALGAVIAFIRHAARRSARGKRGRPRRTVRHLPGRRGGARLRRAGRRRRGADPRSEVVPCRLRDSAAGPRRMEGASAGVGVVRVPDDRPAVTECRQRDPRHAVLDDGVLLDCGIGDGHRGADRVGVRLRLPAEDAVGTHQGA